MKKKIIIDKYENSIIELNDFLIWCDNFSKEKNFNLSKRNRHNQKGFWTYDNDFFSWDYFQKLIKEEYIVINEHLGEKPREIKKDETHNDIINEFSERNRVQPWYYKNQGKIFEGKVIENSSTVFNKFEITNEIIINKSNNYHVHADWWGLYFLTLTILTGKVFNERTFSINELYGIREFIEKEKIKGAILTLLVDGDKEIVKKYNLLPLLNMFDTKELDYLKLLFVSKNDSIIKSSDSNIKFILAYSK